MKAADALLLTLMNNIGAEISDFELQRFRVALHQFCRPLVSGIHTGQAPIHYGGIHLHQVDQQTLEGLERAAARTTPQRSNQNPDHGNRYRLIAPAPELDEDVTEEEHVGRHAPKDTGASKSSEKKTKSVKKGKAKRTVAVTKRLAQFIKDTASGEIKDASPEKITYKDPDTGKHINLHQKSRYVATVDAGLYSSILAAAVDRARRDQKPDHEGVAEASLINKVIDKVVDEMSRVRYVGNHIANMAIREAYYWDSDAMLEFYELFFQDGKKAAQDI